MSEKLILVTNDDGWDAQGIGELAKLMAEFGKVVVVGPSSQRSGSGMALSVEKPIGYQFEKTENEIDFYSCTGTPVDCVKFACRKILNCQPDFVVSGINHGSNISCNVLYSGTMGAAIEACLNGIPSVGFSHMSHDKEIDFSWTIKQARQIFSKVMKTEMPLYTCLNINFPNIEEKDLKGIKVTRQAEGRWIEEYQNKEGDEFVLGGKFQSMENGTEDHDLWAIKNNFIAITPIKITITDMENFNSLADTYNSEL